MIIQSQSPDGGWDERSLVVYTVLIKHGLLLPLSNMPARAHDWRIVHSIPAPLGDLHTMTWDGANLWTLDRASDTAIAVSPEDGREVTRIKIPLSGPGRIGGIGWYNNHLAVTAGGTEHHDGPSRLYLVNPDTAIAEKVIDIDAQWGPSGSTQIGDDLWIAHGCWLVVINPITGEHHGREHKVYGSWPHDLAAQSDAFWHTDEWAPFLFRSDTHDNLLDSSEQPFFSRLNEGLPTRGLAYDGERLWALDEKNKQICVIERNASAQEEKLS